MVYAQVLPAPVSLQADSNFRLSCNKLCDFLSLNMSFPVPSVPWEIPSVPSQALTLAFWI